MLRALGVSRPAWALRKLAPRGRDGAHPLMTGLTLLWIDAVREAELRQTR